jgi:hypothetical protein
VGCIDHRVSGVGQRLQCRQVYLGRAVDELRSRSETIPDELLAHVAPLGWEHIAFNGDYVWPAQPLATAFRTLRNPRPEFLENP